MMFSFLVPKNQETEISGFFVYCTQIISWLPNILYSVINEVGAHPRFGIWFLNIFVLLGLVFMFLLSSWENVKLEIKGGESTDGNDDDDKNDNAGVKEPEAAK